MLTAQPSFFFFYSYVFCLNRTLLHFKVQISCVCWIFSCTDVHRLHIILSMSCKKPQFVELLSMILGHVGGLLVDSSKTGGHGFDSSFHIFQRTCLSKMFSIAANSEKKELLNGQAKIGIVYGQSLIRRSCYKLGCVVHQLPTELLSWLRIP